MENKVLAVVAGNEITQKDLEDIINKYPEDRRMYLNTERGRKELLEQTIAFELFNKFGNEIGLDNTDEYKNTLNSLAKELLTQMSVQKILSDVTVTEEEIKKFYEDNKEQFMDKETVSAKHILVESEDAAKQIKEEIDNGSISFENAAAKYSSCPSKEEGGNLGEFGRGMMVPEFENMAFSSEVGKVTDPVQTQFGYHLILVEKKNEAKEKSFEEVKDMVANQLMQQAQQKKYVDMVFELESKYGVDRK